jgi:hypothetical protein
MTDITPDAIWPPHEAFYVEAMLMCTGVALRAAEDVRVGLEHGARHAPASAEWQDSAEKIINGIQVIALQAAAVSRYLWPVRKEKLHQARGARLRDGLGVLESSALKNRDLRNQLEHFDERLDGFCQTLSAGQILPTYVGPSGSDPEVPTFLFRAYYTDVAVFEILGKRFEMVPILDAIDELHDRLVECAARGGRIPKSTAAPTSRLTNVAADKHFSDAASPQ